MNILICDDIHSEALKLDKIIKEAGGEAACVYFDNGADVLAYLESGAKVDVCFLDIILPEINGIELARRMRSANYNGKIVFLSTSSDYGIESYQVKAYSYLLKPVKTGEVLRILQEIKNLSYTEDTAGIKLSARNMSKFLYFHEIAFIEVSGHTVYFRLLDGTELALNVAFNTILPQLLADGRFAQCHRSYVVNMDAVSQINGREIILRCGRKAPLSRSYKEFNGKYFMHIFGDEKQSS